MLIKALCDYYDLLSKDNKVLPDGYSNVKIRPGDIAQLNIPPLQ